MAKVIYSTLISGLAGKIGNSVLFRSPSSHFGYLRNYAYPRLTDHMHEIGSVAKNLTIIWNQGSSEFKEELQTYCDWYHKVPKVGDELGTRTASCFSLWIKIMYRWAKDHEDVDLSTFTMEDFVVTGTAVSTVKYCIMNGYLIAPPFDYSEMTAAF